MAGGLGDPGRPLSLTSVAFLLLLTWICKSYHLAFPHDRAWREVRPQV